MAKVTIDGIEVEVQEDLIRLSGDKIAEGEVMPPVQADILLNRARDALAQARTLIEQCGYARRQEELADAAAALV